MFKPLHLIVLLSTIVGCSQNEAPQRSQKPEVVVNLEFKSGILTGTTDFGAFETKSSSKMMTFQISNNGDEPLVGPASLDNADFELIYQNCPASLAPKKSCLAKVSFSPSGKNPGNYQANLNLDAVYSALTATVNAPEVAANEVKFSLSSNEVSNVDFGQISENKVLSRQFLLRTPAPNLYQAMYQCLQDIVLLTITAPINHWLKMPLVK